MNLLCSSDCSRQLWLGLLMTSIFEDGMAKSLREAIGERRHLLQDPYAYIGELEEMAAVSETRQLMGDPYACVDEVNHFNGPVIAFDGIPVAKPAQKSRRPASESRRYTDEQIERIVRDLQNDMWQKRTVVFPGAVSTSPVDMLDPSAAFRFLNYDFDLADTLGQFMDGGRLMEVAGTIDKRERLVRVSRQFPPRTRTYTAAHELGHALLHQAVGMHRDRPVDGTLAGREVKEYEADKFAVYYLMPGKLVTSVFESIFGAAPFELNDDTRFALSGALANQPRPGVRTLRDLSRLIAGTTRFNGRDIVALADQFRVSVEAMAIRLEELHLIALD
jgi:hypothetical protein